jgi:hypothetical protein
MKSKIIDIFEKIKLVLVIIGILSIIQFCYSVDDDASQVYPDIKINKIKKGTNKLTVDRTNQKVLKKIHKSKYDSTDRIVEPIVISD